MQPISSPDELSAPFDDVISQLRTAVGEDGVLVDAASRNYYANDLFWQPGILPEAIVFPSTQDNAAEVIRIASGAGLAVLPRGGGMSYSKGYLPAARGELVVDASRLTRVVEVNVGDFYITVEAGCTWAEVAAALDGTGLRTPFWGPLSGRNATVGGALAQNGAFYGSTMHGPVANSVIGVSVVLADGTLVTTGSGSRQNTKPFTRDGGPDMTGLFIGDNGALGFKVGATLRLEPRPEYVGSLSFGFSSMAAMTRAQVEMSALDAISEGFGIDRKKAELSSSFDLPAPGRAAHAERDTTSLTQHAYTLHLVVEGRTASVLRHSMSAVREAGCRHGVEIAPRVPTALRAHPFGPLRGILGRNGERWAPVHGIFPMSAAVAVCGATEGLFTKQEELMHEHGIRYSVMTMTVGAEFFIEPSFYWLDEITPLHSRTLGREVVAPWVARPANDRTRQAVVMIRRKVQELYASLGGISWQAARDYPFREVMKPEAYGMLSALKRALDPKGLMNPGALGLD